MELVLSQDHQSDLLDLTKPTFFILPHIVKDSIVSSTGTEMLLADLQPYLVSSTEGRSCSVDAWWRIRSFCSPVSHYNVMLCSESRTESERLARSRWFLCDRKQLTWLSSNMLHEGCHVSRGLSLHFNAVTSIFHIIEERGESLRHMAWCEYLCSLGLEIWLYFWFLEL